MGLVIWLVAVGVPQGCVLGPVPYFGYTNDLPLLPEVMLSLFVEDSTFCYSLSGPGHASVVLQCHLDLLPDLLRKWRVVINKEIRSNLLYTEVHVHLPVPLPRRETNLLESVSEVPGSSTRWSPNLQRSRDCHPKQSSWSLSQIVSQTLVPWPPGYEYKCHYLFTVSALSTGVATTA